MAVLQGQEWAAKKCVPCEGGVPRIEEAAAKQLLGGLEGWTLAQGGKAIEKRWTVKNFVAGMKFLQQIAGIAEEEQHHPDVHLTGYRNVAVQLTTHAIGGLSENDFILAAKIDQLPVELKQS
jgi:4a-hydroxytetrahydrobiopterin dehydratase